MSDAKVLRIEDYDRPERPVVWRAQPVEPIILPVIRIDGAPSQSERRRRRRREKDRE